MSTGKKSRKNVRRPSKKINRRRTRKEHLLKHTLFHGIPMIYGGTPNCHYYQTYFNKVIYLGVSVSFASGNLMYQLSNCILPRYQEGEDSRYGNQDLFTYKGFNWADAESLFQTYDKKQQKVKDQNGGKEVSFNEEYFIDMVFDKMPSLVNDPVFQSILAEGKKDDPLNLGKIYFGIQIECSNKDSMGIPLQKGQPTTGAQIHFKLCEFIVPALCGLAFANIDALLLFGDKYGDHNVKLPSSPTDQSPTIFSVLRKNRISSKPESVETATQTGKLPVAVPV